MRSLYGFKAKQIGKKFPRIYTLSDGEFRDKIRAACWQKLHANNNMLIAFNNSVLPFAHYYVYGEIIRDAGYEWITQMWEVFRQYIKNNYAV